MLNSRDKIESWLNEMNITNYIINKNLVVDVKSDVTIRNQNLKEIPIQFGLIDGYFVCANNLLKNLKGSPSYVKSFFDCSSNKLISLIGCPEVIDGSMNISYNNINSFIDGPKIIHGNIVADDCLITKLILDELPHCSGFFNAYNLNNFKIENFEDLYNQNGLKVSFLEIKRRLKAIELREFLENKIIEKKQKIKVKI